VRRRERTYEDAPHGTVPPMVPVDRRTKAWMADRHDVFWRLHLEDAWAA
jgi:hypothetical protein